MEKVLRRKPMAAALFFLTYRDKIYPLGPQCTVYLTVVLGLE